MNEELMFATEYVRDAKSVYQRIGLARENIGKGRSNQVLTRAASILEYIENRINVSYEFFFHRAHCGMCDSEMQEFCRFYNARYFRLKEALSQNIKSIVKERDLRFPRGIW